MLIKLKSDIVKQDILINTDFIVLVGPEFKGSPHDVKGLPVVDFTQWAITLNDGSPDPVCIYVERLGEDETITAFLNRLFDNKNIIGLSA